MKTKNARKNVNTPKTESTQPPVETTSPEPPPVEPKATTPSKGRKTKKASDASAKSKVTAVQKLSALDAAAQVLATSKEPLTCKELIERMQAEGLWTTTRGQTPDATLNASLHREIKLKGNASRFAKIARGKFTLSSRPK
jgi:hypothetical protein